MKKSYAVTGLLAGFLNGLFGAGGGIMVVPMLERAGIMPKKAHATSVAIIASLTIISCFFYFNNGELDFYTALQYIPAGIVGALVGTYLMKKIPTKLLKRIFGAVMIISAVRILWK